MTSGVLAKSAGKIILSSVLALPVLHVLDDSVRAGGSDVWLELIFGSGLLALAGWSLSNWGALRELKGRFAEAKENQRERMDRTDGEIKGIRELIFQVNRDQDEKRHDGNNAVAIKFGEHQISVAKLIENAEARVVALDSRIRQLEIANGRKK